MPEKTIKSISRAKILNLEMDMLQTHLQCWLNIWDMMLQIDTK